MKIFISADIEGVAGVVVPQHGAPGNPEYESARRLMTQEVNAAIAGAFEGGATEVLVNDSHGPMTNLLPEELDPRAELILGRPKPGGMFAGLTKDHAGAFCTGYHSGAGRHGILSHTVSGFATLQVIHLGAPAKLRDCRGIRSSLGSATGGLPRCGALRVSLLALECQDSAKLTSKFGVISGSRTQAIRTRPVVAMPYR